MDQNGKVGASLESSWKEASDENNQFLILPKIYVKIKSKGC